jgi:hypothetical protein
MKNLCLLLILCFGIHSCGSKDYTQDFETTIRVVDMSDKPLKGRKVRLYVIYGIEYSAGSNKLPTHTVETDVNGNAVFNYGLDISDSGVDYATFLTDDDTIWKVVSYPSQYAMNNKTKKQELKIFMDSLMTVKVSLQKTSATPLELWLTASNTFYNRTYGIDNTSQIGVNRDFGYWQRTNTGVFDSLFVLKIFSKAQCSISSRTSSISVLPNGQYMVNYFDDKKIDFQQGQKRDSLYPLIVK